MSNASLRALTCLLAAGGRIAQRCKRLHPTRLGICLAPCHQYPQSLKNKKKKEKSAASDLKPSRRWMALHQHQNPRHAEASISAWRLPPASRADRLESWKGPPICWPGDMHVCVCVCMYVYIYIYRNVCIYIYVCVYIYIYMKTWS